MPSKTLQTAEGKRQHHLILLNHCCAELKPCNLRKRYKYRIEYKLLLVDNEKKNDKGSSISILEGMKTK